MSEITGKIRILKIKRVGATDFKQVGFLLVNNWQKLTSMLPVTTRNDGGYRSQIPLEKSGNISFTCMVFEDEDYIVKDRISYKELMEIHSNDELVDWVLIAEGKNLAHAGKGHFTSLNEVAANDGIVQVDGALEMFGRWLDFNDVEPPSQPLLTLDDVDSFNLTADVSWTSAVDNFGVIGYQLRLSATNQPDVFINVGDINSYVLTGLQYFTFYGINVRAQDAAGNYSAWSTKRLIFIRLPSGVPEPSYMQFEDGRTIEDESGIPLEFE